MKLESAGGLPAILSGARNKKMVMVDEAHRLFLGNEKSNIAGESLQEVIERVDTSEGEAWLSETGILSFSFKGAALASAAAMQDASLENKALYAFTWQNLIFSALSASGASPRYKAPVKIHIVQATPTLIDITSLSAPEIIRALSANYIIKSIKPAIVSSISYSQHVDEHCVGVRVTPLS